MSQLAILKDFKLIYNSSMYNFNLSFNHKYDNITIEKDLEIKNVKDPSQHNNT